MLKNYKNYLIIILVILTLTTSALLYYTYAKYISSVNSNAEITVARWNITLNNQDITTGSELSNIIVPVFEGTDHIAPGVIAPTAEGYFDIILDASNTDVSLKYTITTSNNEESAVKDLIVSGYSINNGERQNIEALENNSDLKIEDTILYNSENKNVTIRVYLKWNDDEETGAIMNNSEDANATKGENNKAKINVNVKVIQVPNT